MPNNRSNYKAGRPPRPARDRSTPYERRRRQKARERWWHENRPPKV